MFGCFMFTLLNVAKFYFILQHYFNGYLPFSEANYVLDDPASFFYDIFSLEISGR